MRTVAIICILNALLEYNNHTVTALLEYLDRFTNSSRQHYCTTHNIESMAVVP